MRGCGKPQFRAAAQPWTGVLASLGTVRTPSRPGQFAITVLRAIAGLSLGALTAWVEPFCVLAAYAVTAVAGRIPTIAAIVARFLRALAECERWRVVALLGSTDFPRPRIRQSLDAIRDARRLDGRVAGYLVVRSPLGLLGGVILLLIAFGAVASVRVLADWILIGDSDEVGAPNPFNGLYLLFFGAVMAFLAIAGLTGVVLAERWLARRLLAPSQTEVMRRRIAELASTRAAVVDAVTEERRRIERALHDGVQQRLVALGMLIGRARRSDDPARVGDLLRQAHEESGRALDELREVAWRIYPTALDDGGLPAALETVAERSGLPVQLRVRALGPVDTAIAAAGYFVVSEAVTNAVKHSGADAITIDVDRDGPVLRLAVRDDGRGGADPAGTGLAGLARRVAALDGRFAVDSPSGGPTTIVAELPCG